MIITTDTEGWYESLVKEHERKANAAEPDSGARHAYSIITEELKQMYRDRSLRFTIHQAIVLLCARIRMRMYTLTETNSFTFEKKEVYYRFLAAYSKKLQRETPLSISKAVQDSVFNRHCTSPIQAYCFGLFVRYASFGDDYNSASPIASVAYMREWLLKHVDYYETLNIDYEVRQEAVSAFICILGIFH